MKLTTSNGHAYDVHWAAVASTKILFIQMDDERPLSAIAQEFEGLEWLRREDEFGGTMLYEGFSELESVKRVEPGVVLLSLKKAVTA